MLNKKWLAGAILGAFLTVTAGAFAPHAEASALTPTAIKTEASTVELAKHPGEHKPPKQDKKFDQKHDKKFDNKHDKKFDKKHDKKHDKHKKYDKKHDKKRDKHKKYDRHDRDRFDKDRHDRPHHGKPMPPRR